MTRNLASHISKIKQGTLPSRLDALENRDNETMLWEYHIRDARTQEYLDTCWGVFWVLFPYLLALISSMSGEEVSELLSTQLLSVHVHDDDG